MNLDFTFVTQVLFDPEVDDGYMKHYVPLPADIARALNDAHVTHVEGSLNARPFRRVVQRRGDNSACLKFGKFWLADAQLSVNDNVSVQLWPDPNPDRIELPEELVAALVRAPAQIAERWSQMSVSRQKTLAYHVMRAKRSETRQRRADAIIADLMADQDDIMD